MTDASGTTIEEGSKVAWNWGSGHVKGEVIEVTEGKVTKEIAGKTISRNGTEDNPAVYIEHKGNNVLKKASELHVLDDGEELQKGEQVETAAHNK
ncbi:hypothetical protein HKX48_002792 [Thoreauomyces humboldtii]|nr:hypothetical protein HKX48_002792 [Thoreauomyces humboldtii]